jgi:diamine N-acetyltransferase
VEIYLKDIDSSSWRDCIQLEVKEEQRPFIQSNLHSIAESRFQNGMRLLGIYKDHIMVGFASYILDEDGDMNLYKLMIDKNYQGKGYGRKALALVMDMIKKETLKKEVWLSLHPDNAAAIKLYSGYGFRRQLTGLEAEDEIFFKYDILE